MLGHEDEFSASFFGENSLESLRARAKSIAETNEWADEWEMKAVESHFMRPIVIYDMHGNLRRNGFLRERMEAEQWPAGCRPFLLLYKNENHYHALEVI